MFRQNQNAKADYAQPPIGSSTTPKMLHKTQPSIFAKAASLLKKHPKRVAVTTAFCSAYLATSYSALGWKNEALRMGIAGSMASIICEGCFHLVDTVNIRAKAQESGRLGEKLPSSTFSFIKTIWAKEGIAGFTKGFSACFYSAAICGFVYFSVYKAMKEIFKDRLCGSGGDLALCYLVSSLTT